MLTSEQAGAIYAAVHADLEAEQAARVGNDQAVTDWLNEPAITVYRRITSNQLLRWAAVNGIMQKIQNEATNGTNGKRSIAQAALYMLQGTLADLKLDSEVLGMLDHLVNGGVLSAGDRADMMARAAEQISRADHIIGRPATNEDVGLAMAIDRPNGKIPKAQVL